MANCPACVATEQFLHSRGYTNYKSVQVRSSRDLPPGTDGTVPQLTYRGQLIGGKANIERWLSNVPARKSPPPQVNREQQKDDDFMSNLFGSQEPSSSSNGDYCSFEGCFTNPQS